MYAELHCLSHYTFLRGASYPHELVAKAKQLGYGAIAITDECSLAGIVKAHVAAQARGIKLIVGSEFCLSNGERLVVLAPTRRAYAELSGFITLARRRATKGDYQAHFDDLRFRLQHCFIIWLADSAIEPGAIQAKSDIAKQFQQAFKRRLWLGVSHHLSGGEKERFLAWQALAQAHELPLVACGSVLMHESARKPLQDVLTALREKTTVQNLGTRAQANAEAHLKSVPDIQTLYPESLLVETALIADQCVFSLNELKYQYPKEVVPVGESAIAYLTRLVEQGCTYRWPEGVPDRARNLIDKELDLIESLQYEYYFLTVYDIVRFARGRGILCQGRGSAANSVVCYCLMITEISPDLINVLFERFISKERDEPPDIDVDFEHARREEVIQYIYQKYGRERAALAATVITYRSRSAVRDVGKALGLDASLIDHLAGSLAWWDRQADLQARMQEVGLHKSNEAVDITALFYSLVHQILGFPRHLSQHVGGFVITQDKTSDLVPIENAAMPERTIIQWDKDDLEAMGLMKVDVLALGMLTAIRKALSYVRCYQPDIQTIGDIPKEDAATYAMLSAADSVGVFQVESRAQMSMLPRLKPKQFYDLVIQIAIVRPGPIQGGMVHPYLKRRNGIEPVSYYNDALKEVLAPTLGVPIFQEQAIRLSMVAAGFSGGQADQLRRAMASWGKNGDLLKFERAFIDGMLGNGYPEAFALRTFEQIKGFGGYGFPESHSASFAILCYFSSWLKCHHPAAFYCALLNSQPMGFYSPSQLIQDARRHAVAIYPIDIQVSDYENTLEQASRVADREVTWGIRLGFIQVKGLDARKAKNIVAQRAEKQFDNIESVFLRTDLNAADMQLLASAEVFHRFAKHRFEARWQVSSLQPPAPLFDANSTVSSTDNNHADCAYKDRAYVREKENTRPLPSVLNDHPKNTDSAALVTAPPTMEYDIAADLAATRVSLRPHIMALLRKEPPFTRCKRQAELPALRSGGFVQVAGLVSGRQRPGTAKGTLFLTLEDETGNINVVVWPRTQTLFRQALLTGKLLLVKGTIDTEGSVVHVIAGQVHDYSQRLADFDLRSRDFH